MKTVISGKLAKTPEIREVETKNSSTKVANFTVFAYDANAPVEEREGGSSYKKGIPFNCAAWGENAEHVSGLKAGDTLTASAIARYNEFSKKDGSKVVEANYSIRRIDPGNVI